MRFGEATICSPEGESAFARCASFGETDFARRILAWLGRQRRPGRSSAKPSEVWLGRRDSNPDNHVQSVVSYR